MLPTTGIVLLSIAAAVACELGLRAWREQDRNWTNRRHDARQTPLTAFALFLMARTSGLQKRLSSTIPPARRVQLRAASAYTSALLQKWLGFRGSRLAAALRVWRWQDSHVDGERSLF